MGRSTFARLYLKNAYVCATFYSIHLRDFFPEKCLRLRDFYVGDKSNILSLQHFFKNNVNLVFSLTNFNFNSKKRRIQKSTDLWGCVKQNCSSRCKIDLET